MTPPASMHIEYRAAQNIFSVRWLTDSPLATLQAEYESLLTLESAHLSVRWLLDIRQRPIPSIESVNWVTLNWLPRAAALLAPARLCVAYVISTERAEAMAADPDLTANVNDAMAPNRHYHLALFGTEAEAESWLLA